MYYLYSFRSRNQSMRFYDALKKEGISSKIINTPKSVSVGCGLSVQVACAGIEKASRIFSLGVYDTFIGLFYVNADGVKRIQ